MNSHDWNEELRLGHSGDESWEVMQRADQRIVLFNVLFEELVDPPELRDYRLSLEQVWAPFLRESRLSASLIHSGWHPEHGPMRSVIGWVWRQHGGERLDSVSEVDLFQLSELLRAPGSRVAGFVLTEQLTTDHFGKHRNKRKLKLSKGKFVVEPPPE